MSENTPAYECFAVEPELTKVVPAYLAQPADGICSCGADLRDEVCRPDCADPYMATVRRVAAALELARVSTDIRDITLAMIAIDAVAAEAEASDE